MKGVMVKMAEEVKEKEEKMAKEVKEKEEKMAEEVKEKEEKMAKELDDFMRRLCWVLPFSQRVSLTFFRRYATNFYLSSPRRN